jgi:hypothetical protein
MRLYFQYIQQPITFARLNLFITQYKNSFAVLWSDCINLQDLLKYINEKYSQTLTLFKSL